jgi:hypothetical protein
MNELLLGTFALALGGIAAWLWRASLAAEALRRETERRASAEAGAARVPALEAALAERERLLAERGAKLAELETRIAEERKAAEEMQSTLNVARA